MSGACRTVEGRGQLRPLRAFGRPLSIPADETLGEWPILALAASCLDEERVRAFTALYQAMRRADDLVDDRRKGHRAIPLDEQRCIERLIRGSMTAPAGGALDGSCAELVAIKRRFSLPAWPFERWANAMVRDLHCSGFETWRDFYRYALGAAAAPGAIFLHLAAATRSGDGYLPPAFDIDAQSRPLALFAYTVHLLRDFRKDQIDGLNAFPRALLARFGLHEARLRDIAARPAEKGKCELPPELVAFLRGYCAVAEHYRVRARRAIDTLSPLLAPRARLSLEIVYALYLQLLEKVDAAAVPDLIVTPRETRDCIATVISAIETCILPPWPSSAGTTWSGARCTRAASLPCGRNVCVHPSPAASTPSTSSRRPTG